MSRGSAHLPGLMRSRFFVCVSSFLGYVNELMWVCVWKCNCACVWLIQWEVNPEHFLSHSDGLWLDFRVLNLIIVEVRMLLIFRDMCLWHMHICVINTYHTQDITTPSPQKISPLLCIYAYYSFKSPLKLTCKAAHLHLTALLINALAINNLQK